MTILILLFLKKNSAKKLYFINILFAFFYFNYISHIPTLIPGISTLIRCIPTSIPRLPFPNSPFPLLQIILLFF